MIAAIVRPWEKRSNTASAIDELGSIRDKIKELQDREKKLVEVVRDMGEGEHGGVKCKAIVSVTESSRLDTTSLKAVLPDEFIAKYTTFNKVVRVTIKPKF